MLAIYTHHITRGLGEVDPEPPPAKPEPHEIQQAALDEPETYDDETRELWAMLRQERMRRAA